MEKAAEKLPVTVESKVRPARLERATFCFVGSSAGLESWGIERHLLTLNIICYELQPPADNESVKGMASISICSRYSGHNSVTAILA
jgi:hypothetical protein